MNGEEICQDSTLSYPGDRIPTHFWVPVFLEPGIFHHAPFSPLLFLLTILLTFFMLRDCFSLTFY